MEADGINPIQLQIGLVTALMNVKGYAAPETKAAEERARLLIEEAEALGEPPATLCSDAITALTRPQQCAIPPPSSASRCLSAMTANSMGDSKGNDHLSIVFIV